MVDVDGQHGDAVAAGVLDQLGGAVKTHGLAVEQAGKERRRVVALEPGGDVGQQGEAGGVGFGETVAAKALDLLEQAAGEVLVVAALDHASGELLLEGQQLAVPAPVGDGAAQLVRLAAAEKPAATMARRITCSWKMGTPRVRSSTDLMASLG